LDVKDFLDHYESSKQLLLWIYLPEGDRHQ